MILKQFLIFAAIAKHRNVARASEELQISQPGVAQELKLLEQNFGVKLVTKSGRGIDLTDAGWRFLNQITPILSQVEDLNRDLGPSAAPKAESLAIGGTYSTSTSVLPSVLALFKKSHPRAEVALRTGQRRFVERLLLATEIEIALVAGAPRSDRLVAELYRKSKLVAIVPKHHPLAQKPKVSVLELADTPLVIRGGPSQKSTTENLLRASPIQRSLNIAMRCDSPEAIKLAVREEMGVGILYEDAARAEIKKGEFKALKLSDMKLEGESWIVYRRDKALSSLAVDFLKLVRDCRDKDQRRLAAALSVDGEKNFYGRSLLFGPPHSDETPDV
ncbi:MAG TPA: LysR family transcriptional regulator [Candidatus Binatia bacterium]